MLLYNIFLASWATKSESSVTIGDELEEEDESNVEDAPDSPGSSQDETIKDEET
jgi:hypothetical protein